ncbi:hypothetical protein Trydic_g16086 [Trypoxylus dichotomus]
MYQEFLDNELPQVLEDDKVPPTLGAPEIINNNSVKIEEFANYFEGTFRRNLLVDRNHEKFTDVINKGLHTEYRDITNIQETTTEELRNTIKTLGKRKAPGYDGITNTAIKNLTLEAVDTLKDIINAVIRYQYYTKTWKHATIIITHKSGKPKNKTNRYRSVSLLPGLVMQLLRMSEHITSNVDKPTPTAASMLYIEKAFNKLWRDDLIYKMRLHLIPATLPNLIQHYLRDRTFSVNIEEDISIAGTTQAGLSQGSVLGPLRFNTYTSDIP